MWWPGCLKDQACVAQDNPSKLPSRHTSVKTGSAGKSIYDGGTLMFSQISFITKAKAFCKAPNSSYFTTSSEISPPAGAGTDKLATSLTDDLAVFSTLTNVNEKVKRATAAIKRDILVFIRSALLIRRLNDGLLLIA